MDRHDRDIASLNNLAESNLDLSNKNHQLNEENAALSAKVSFFRLAYVSVFLTCFYSSEHYGIVRS